MNFLPVDFLRGAIFGQPGIVIRARPFSGDRIMKKTMGIIMLAIAGLLMLNVGLISADEHPTATV